MEISAKIMPTYQRDGSYQWLDGKSDHERHYTRAVERTAPRGKDLCQWATSQAASSMGWASDDRCTHGDLHILCLPNFILESPNQYFENLSLVIIRQYASDRSASIFVKHVTIKEALPQGPLCRVQGCRMPQSTAPLSVAYGMTRIFSSAPSEIFSS
jgi:hypothetical protein